MKTAEVVTTARRLSRLSQRELARRAGVPQSTVARIESGAIEPRSSTIDRILSSMNFEVRLEPRFSGGADISLIRRFLRLSPAQRIQYAASGGRLTKQLREGLRGG
jgi:transcriptional regulator with XRE-family HTH domain